VANPTLDFLFQSSTSPLPTRTLTCIHRLQLFVPLLPCYSLSPMDQNQRRRLGTVATIIAAAGVVTLLIAAYLASSNIIVLKTWKPVEAQLVDTTVKNDKNYASIQTARADNYLVVWTFRYNVGGTDHIGATDPGTHGNYKQMMAWARRFNPGQTVTIHYQPDNPSVISAAQWDWITFSHAVWVGAWGLGILILGLIMKKLAS
jgi:hypothetical protein